MLSKIEDTTPKASVLFHVAVGSSSTGLNDAHRTSASKKRLPLPASLARLQLSGRHNEPAINTSHNAAARSGKRSAHDPGRLLAMIFVDTTATSVAATTPSRR